MNSCFIPLIDNGLGLSRTSWAGCMMGLMLSDVFKGRTISIESISYPYPDGAMRLCTDRFLKSGYGTMLVIDTDLIFEPRHVAMLLEHDVPFVSGLYPKKQVGLTYPAQPLESNPRPFDKEAGALCEVARCARGFTRFDREVFERMAPHVPTYIDEDGKEQKEFWKCLPGGHSEDFNFCDKWRSIGGKVYVDKRATVLHEGSAVYPIKGTY